MRVCEGIADVGDVEAFVSRLSDIGGEHGVAVQALDARYVIDRAHLEQAVRLAERAAQREDRIARDHGMEILLYAAGTRQIEVALEMGVSTGRCPLVVVITPEPDETCADEPRADEPRADEPRADEPRPDESVALNAAATALKRHLADAETLGDYDPDRVRAYFDVSAAELDATAGDLADLVRERVALLVVEK